MPATEAAALIAAARRWPAAPPGRVSPLAPGSSHRLFAAVLAGEPVVVKVFRDARRGEPDREWEALRLLGGSCAPAPLHRSHDGGPATIVMRRAAGAPRPLAALDDRQLAALAAAHDRVRAAVPASRRRATGHPVALLARTRDGLADLASCPPGPHAAALRLARAWADGCTSAWGGGEAFGRGDPNAANYLWDGDDVMLVDFEDSGLNVPAVALADLVEHVANRGLPEATVGRLGHLWGLARRRAGLAEARRLAACFWLVVLERNRRAGLPARQVTAAQQAARVQELLG
jgi:hypothetical protein